MMTTLTSYSQEYWDSYYGGPYETTYKYGFPLARIIEREWAAVYSEPPRSFADIGCGPGHTLIEAQSLLPPNALVYGVEIQQLPEARTVSKNIYFGDFMTIYPQLPKVDLLYVACSMYIPWDKQAEFLVATLALAGKAVVFANVYLEDGLSIPDDSMRRSIYRDRDSFRKAAEAMGYSFRGSRSMDFFTPPLLD